MISYQWTSAALGIFIAAKIFLLVRRDVLHSRYVYWWLTVACLTLVGGAFPRLVDYVARLAGVSYPPILAVILGVGLLLVKMLAMDIDRSRQEQKIRRLTQRLAIMEADLDEPRAARKGGRGER